MSQAGLAPSQKLVTELKVSGHLMTLDRGLFCVFHAQGSVVADPQTGLPGVRITQPPLQDRSRVSISSFNDDGWIGAEGSAALVRINEGPSQLLVTIYQNGTGQHEAPKLQVMRLGDVTDAARTGSAVQAAAAVQAPSAAQAAGPVEAAAAQALPGAGPADTAAADAPAEAPEVAAPEVAAHVQRRGDKLGRLGDWMGEPGSQSWIEGFAIAPNKLVGPEDIEYQAVLGKGWLSPWSEGGQYCGSRGMALPILGLRVRLKGRAVQSHSLRVSATFTDGSRVGPLSDTETAEAESLAPLEAFRIEILPHDAAPFDAEEADDIEDGEESVAASAPAKPAVDRPDVSAPVRATVPPAKALPVEPPSLTSPPPKQPLAKQPVRDAPARTAPAKIGMLSKPLAKTVGKLAPRKPAGPTRR